MWPIAALPGKLSHLKPLTAREGIGVADTRPVSPVKRAMCQALLRLAVVLLLLPCEAGGKASKGQRQAAKPQAAAPIDLPDESPVEDRLKAAIVTLDHAAVEEILATATDPAADLAADTGHASEAVKQGYLPPGTPLMAAIFASNTRAIGQLLAHGADGTSGGTSHPMQPAETAAFRADPHALSALHKGGVDVTRHGPHGFATLHLVARSVRPQGRPTQAIGFLVNHTAGPRMDVDLPAVAALASWMGHDTGEEPAVVGCTPLMSAAGQPAHTAALAAGINATAVSIAKCNLTFLREKTHTKG